MKRKEAKKEMMKTRTVTTLECKKKKCTLSVKDSRTSPRSLYCKSFTFECSFIDALYVSLVCLHYKKEVDHFHIPLKYYSCTTSDAHARSSAITGVSSVTFSFIFSSFFK